MKRLLRLLLVVALIAGVIAIYRSLPPLSCAEIQSAARGPSRPWLILAGVVLIFIAAPRWMVIAALGIAFGAWWGFVFAQLSAWVGALAAFWVTRSVGRGLIESRLKNRRWFQALENAMRGGGGFRIALLVRLNPLIHFTISSWALGLTAVGIVGYAAGTFLGMMPMTAVFAYAGDTLGCSLVDDVPLPHAAKLWLVAGMALMTIASLIPFLVDWMRKKRAREPFEVDRAL